MIHHPICRRRAEGIPVLRQKALDAFAAHYGKDKAAALMSLFADRTKLEAMPVHGPSEIRHVLTLDCHQRRAAFDTKLLTTD